MAEQLQSAVEEACRSEVENSDPNKNRKKACLRHTATEWEDPLHSEKKKTRKEKEQKHTHPHAAQHSTSQ